MKKAVSKKHFTFEWCSFNYFFSYKIIWKSPRFLVLSNFLPDLSKWKFWGIPLGCLVAVVSFVFVVPTWKWRNQSPIDNFTGKLQKVCKGSSLPWITDQCFPISLSLVTSFSAKISMIIHVFTSNERPLNPFNIATPSEVEAVAHACIRIQNGVQRKGCLDMVAYMTFHLKKCPVLQIILSFVE